jgi:hypothetical protein
MECFATLLPAAHPAVKFMTTSNIEPANQKKKRDHQSVVATESSDQTDSKAEIEQDEKQSFDALKNELMQLTQDERVQKAVEKMVAAHNQLKQTKTQVEEDNLKLKKIQREELSAKTM